MSVRSSFFDTLEDVYNFSDSPTNGNESRADSPILGLESEADTALPHSLNSSHSLGSIPTSPLPPFCQPTRRYSRQASVSSTSSIRNAVYLDPELEQSLQSSLRPSTSLLSMRYQQSTKYQRTRASTLVHSPSASVSSITSDTPWHEDNQFATTPTAPAMRRKLPFGPINTAPRIEAAGSSSVSYMHSTGHFGPSVIPYNPESPNPLDLQVTFPTSTKRYSSDEQSDMQSNFSSPPFSRFPSSLGSSRLSTPNTSPASTWSRAEGSRALDAIAHTQEEETRENARARAESSRWSVASSEHNLPVRESRRFFGQSIEGLASFARRETDSYEATLRTLEGQTSPQADTYDTLPKTPKKRQRLRSFISRLSHLPSPNITDAPPTPNKPFRAFLAPPDSREHKRSSFSSLVDKDPFRAPEISILTPASPSLPPEDVAMKFPSTPSKRAGNRRKMKSFFFHS
jgi:hypothetical protein